MKILIVLLAITLGGCNHEGCSPEYIYQDGYREVIWEDGSVTYEPIWYCSDRA